MFNGIFIGKATLTHSRQRLDLTIEWELEIPDVRQIDISLFLLELFRFDHRLGSEPGLDEYDRLSTVTDHLSTFEIRDRYCTLRKRSVRTHLDISRATEP